MFEYCIDQRGVTYMAEMLEIALQARFKRASAGCTTWFLQECRDITHPDVDTPAVFSSLEPFCRPTSERSSNVALIGKKVHNLELITYSSETGKLRNVGNNIILEWSLPLSNYPCHVLRVHISSDLSRYIGVDSQQRIPVLDK